MKILATARTRFGNNLSSIGCFVLFMFAAFAGLPMLSGQTYPTQIGVEVLDRQTGFVDALKDQGRLFMNTAGTATAPTDANGWPTTDGMLVVFDNRPVPAWTGTIDDPAQNQPNTSGWYTMSFSGQATLSSVANAPVLTFVNQAYNSSTNTTTVNVYMPGGATYAAGQAVMQINFTNTIRTFGGATNTGITSVQVIRPGFTLAQANSTQPFDPVFLNALAPFAYLRVMDWLGTNTNPFYGNGSDPVINWSDRSLPTDEVQGLGVSLRHGAWGVSWEYIILLANAANKDIWITVPVNATGSSDPLDPAYVASPDTSSYLYNLASLLKNGNAFTGNVGLNSNLHIYVEDSNEVWNSSSSEDWWNTAAANAEGCNSGSPLCNDGNSNSLDWAARRHIKRMYEIGNIFQGVFGAGSLNNKVRMVYAWWQLDEGSGSRAANALSWFNKTYGAPSNYIYSMAQADYFFNANYANDTTVDEVLQDLQSGSSGMTAQIQYVQSAYTTANQYGLKLSTYEGGPDTGNLGTQSTTNVGANILANRQYAATDDIGIGMDLLLENQLRNQWFPYGGNTFGIFQLSGAYSRYGDYGLTDNLCNLQTAKYSAVLNLTGYTPAVAAAPSVSTVAGNQSVALNWPAVTGAANYTVGRSTTSGGPYTTLGTACTPTYWDSTVTNGTKYYYVVSSVNAVGQQTVSSQVSATPSGTLQAPGAPTSLTASPGNAQAMLTWNAPTTGGAASSYQVWDSTGGGYSEIASTVSGTTYTATGLTNGTQYTFYVTASNSAGTSGASNIATATPTSSLQSQTINFTAPTSPVTYPVSPITLQATATSGLTVTFSVLSGPGTVSGNTLTVTGTGTIVVAANQAGNSTYAAAPQVTQSVVVNSGGGGTLLAYEPFGETSGSTIALSGASGGGDSGWAEAWVVQNGDAQIPGYNIVSTTPLTYSGLQATSNHAVGGYNYVSSGRQLNVNSGGPFNSYLSGGLIGASGQTLWLSFLIRADISNGQTEAVILNNQSGTNAWLSNSSNDIGIGYLGGSAFWGLMYNNGTPVLSNVAVVQGQTTLLVASITFGSTNTINLYVNPTSLGGSAPSTPSATLSTTGSVGFESLAYYGGNGSNGSSLGDISFGGSYAAVTPTSSGLTQQTITFTPPTSPVTYGVSPITLSATATSGLAVTFSVVSGPGTVSGNTLTVTGAGTIVVAANQAGNSTYAAAPQVTQNVAVNKASQTINFTQPTTPVTYGVSPITLSATATSGLAVTFSVSSGPGTISGSTLTVTGVGTIVVAANQSGNSNYSAAAQITKNVVVNQAAQSINFTQPTSPVSYPTSPITLVATATSGLTVTFSIVSGPGTVSGSTLTVTGVGTIVVAANQAGNANYTAAPQVTKNVVVNGLQSQTITFTQPTSPVTYGVSPSTLSATATSGLTVTFSIISGPGTVSGTTLTVTGAGTIVVAANQAGNGTYGPAPQVTRNVVVNQATQTITFTQPTTPVSYGVSPITLSATASSGLTVTFSIVSGPGTVSGSTLTVTGVGTIVVGANQAGNANYTAATQVTKNVVVNQGTQTINFTPPTSPVTYPASPITLVATATSGLTVTFSIVSGPGTVSGTTLTVTGVGTIVVAANQAGNANYAAAPQVTQNVVVNMGGGGTLLAYEPFGETSGTTMALNGASGGGDSGWGAPWFVQNSSTNIPGYNIVSTTPLTYSGLATTTNHAIGGYNYDSSGRQLNVSAGGPFNSYLSGGLIGASGQTIWLSFLVRVDASNGQPNAIILNTNTSGNSWLTNSSNDVGIGYLGGSGFWGLMYNNGTPVLSNAAVTQGQTTLLVASITFGSTSVINLYVNPTSLGGSAPSSPSATISTTGSVAFESLAYVGGYGSNDGSLGDIRVGTTYAAVTP